MSGMKSKTVKSIIKKKFHHWVKSIEDEEIKELIRNDTIITGGCIASMLLGEEVNDFDIYFRNFNTTLKVAQYYVNEFKKKLKTSNNTKIEVQETKDLRENPYIKVVVQSVGVKSEENKIKNQESKNKYRPVFLSTNAITLSDKIQIVLRFFGDPKDIHTNYDFVHCTNYWTSWNDKLVLNPEALECLLSKTLVYQGSLYPVCSIFRLRKFINRGWKINAGQMLKIILQISKLDLTNYDVLSDQLVGVDTSYFEQILQQVRSEDNKKIDSAHLVEVIDNIFSE